MGLEKIFFILQMRIIGDVMDKAKKISVLIVSASTIVRETLTGILSRAAVVKDLTYAKDGAGCISKVNSTKFDVIVLDIPLPNVGGLEVIKQVMSENPTPIVIFSNVSTDVVLMGLESGAMDFVSVGQDHEKIEAELIEKIKIASKVKPIRRMRLQTRSRVLQNTVQDGTKVVAMGVSTGGPQALEVVFSKLPSNFNAAIVVVQHISEGFIEGLVNWLRYSSLLDIKVAKSGEKVKKSSVLFAPDNFHMIIDEEGRVHLSRKELSKFHIPSIDVMMDSVAKSFMRNSIGVIMTGMGSDGVKGIQSIKNSGGVTIAQNEKSSVIFGMNKCAIDTGCVDKIIPVDKIPEELVKVVY